MLKKAAYDYASRSELPKQGSAQRSKRHFAEAGHCVDDRSALQPPQRAAAVSTTAARCSCVDNLSALQLPQ
jgi:hypothetical protein